MTAALADYWWLFLIIFVVAFLMSWVAGAITRRILGS